MATPPQSTLATNLPRELDVFPLRDTVVFPAVPAQLSSTRPSSIQLVTQSVESQKPIALITLKRATDSPTPEDLHHTGTLATIQRMWHLPDGSIRFLVHSTCRIGIQKTTQTDHGLRIQPQNISTPKSPSNQQTQALAAGVSGQFQQILSLSPHLPDELQIATLNIHDPGHLSDFVAFHLNLELAEKQALLDEPTPTNRLKRLTQLLSQELDVLELGLRVRSQVQSELDRSRRDHLIREQIKALQQQLGENDSRSVEIEALKERLAQNNLPPHAFEEAQREIERLSRLPLTAPEYTISRSYIDWLLDLPWARQTASQIDLEHTKKILDQYHNGLDHVKERILDDLAVRKLSPSPPSTILCLVGPPGVGKTSLGQAIAQALNRPFARIALGGMRDEAELRGHRRTYVSALPGRILQSIHQANTNDPVLLLDEIDKLGFQGEGDPTGALLEILDPSQNQAFVDRYLNLPFDLSNVLFITTANVAQNIPEALRDRLDMITISGYLDSEKAAIVHSHILPRQRTAHGLLPKHLKLSQKTVHHIIRHYTQEPGLRQLERQISVLCRKRARNVASDESYKASIQVADLPNYLGTPLPEPIPQMQSQTPGIVTGLAATPQGGQHFHVETTSMQGTGNLILTGHLGDVLKESAQTALSYVRSHSKTLGIDHTYENIDIHIHVPAGAIPKDGPSAGLAIALSILSHITQQAIPSNIALTGEITLTGQVLGVGAIRDKLLAALRTNIQHVILPEANRTTIEALPNKEIEKLRLDYVHSLQQVIQIILRGNPKRVR